MWKAINALQEQIGERNHQRGLDRKRIALLEWYLKLKEKNKRNDNDILCMELRKELMDRPRGMITRDVKNKFDLNHTQQALRLMERVAEEFSLDITLQKGRGKYKGWWIKERIHA